VPKFYSPVSPTNEKKTGQPGASDNGYDANSFGNVHRAVVTSLTFGKKITLMKTIILSIASALVVSLLATMLCYILGARDNTFLLIGIVTVSVSCSTASLAASLGLHFRKKKGAVE
jgi:ABC-type multidrug transport system permease subunit